MLVEAKAPPSTPLISKDLLDQTIDPLVNAALLRGQAKSLGGAACTTGVDLSYGLGHVVDASLLRSRRPRDSTSSTPRLPEGLTDAVSQSRSATRLVAQSGTQGPIKKLGLQSEVRQTIAPVTFFEGTDDQFTIRLLGEWVLRATADGKEGSVFYGPGTVEPETPILQVLDAGGQIIEEPTVSARTSSATRALFSRCPAWPRLPSVRTRGPSTATCPASRWRPPPRPPVPSTSCG